MTTIIDGSGPRPAMRPERPPERAARDRQWLALVHQLPPKERAAFVRWLECRVAALSRTRGA